jgi:hypothetical protein
VRAQTGAQRLARLETYVTLATAIVALVSALVQALHNNRLLHKKALGCTKNSCLRLLEPPETCPACGVCHNAG